MFGVHRGLPGLLSRRGRRRLQHCESKHYWIVEMILSQLDIERLKISRLVCRSWNEEICRLMRSKAIIVINKRDVQEQELGQLIEDGRMLELPSPFWGLMMRMEPARTEDGEQPGFSLSPRLQSSLCLTKITFQVPEAFEFAESVVSSALELLKRSGKTLTHLKSPCWGPIPSSVKKELEFPKLKALLIARSTTNYSNNSDDEMLDFFVTITGLAPNLTLLEVRNPTVCARMDLGSLEKIETLRVVLDSEAALRQCLNDGHGLGSVKINGLKSLSLRLPFLLFDRLVVVVEEIEDQVTAWISSTVARFSGTIKYLQLIYQGFKLNPELFHPQCHGLEELEIASYFGLAWYLPDDGDNVISLSEFPTLKKMKIHDFNPSWSVQMGGQPGRNWSPSLSVRSVHLVRAAYSVFENDLSQVFRQFPNATSWAFDYPMVEDFFIMIRSSSSSSADSANLRLVQSIEKLTVIVNIEERTGRSRPVSQKLLQLVYEELPKLNHLRELNLLAPVAALDLSKFPVRSLPELKTLAFNCEDPKMLIPLVTSRGWEKLESIIILEHLDRKHSLEMERFFCKCPALKYGF